MLSATHNAVGTFHFANESKHQCDSSFGYSITTWPSEQFVSSWIGARTVGKIKSIAVAKGSSGFGYCCFVDEDSVKKAISYQSSIMINGVTPAISLLHGSSNLQFAESNCAQTDGSTKCKKSGRLLCSI